MTSRNALFKSVGGLLFRPFRGSIIFHSTTQGLRPGLHSDAASRLNLKVTDHRLESLDEN
jgi:hypothetical protein